MLSYFPTPYPHEWMYSVYCRYYVRSGQTRRTAIIRELFPDRPHTAIGSLYPNSAILQVSAQLPNYPDARTLMLNHTLFLYHTRCFPAAKKEALITKLSSGTKTILGGIYRDRQLSAPRYCPLCVKDDRADYGEAYWHIEHQIPSMEICPKHECGLLCLDGVDFTTIKYDFYPLDTQNLIPAHSVSIPAHKWEGSFSKILFEYATLPLSYAATPGHSNLATALADMGYEAKYSRDIHTALDFERLYLDLSLYFGTDIVRKVFGDAQMAYQIARVCKWSCLTPERHALLQCYSGIDSATAFSEERKPGSLERQLRALEKTESKYGQQQLCELLGITPSQLNILAQKYDIQPFWKQHRSARTESIHIPLRAEEKQRILSAAAIYGNGQAAVFARSILLREAEKILSVHNQSKEDVHT